MLRQFARRSQVLVFAVAISFVVGPTASASPDSPSAKPKSKANLTSSPLDFVPSDAFGFVHVRVADLWNSAGFADLRGLILKAGPQAWQLFEKKYVPAPSTVESVIVVYPTDVSLHTPMFFGDPDAVSPLVIIRTTEPYDRPALHKALGAHARLKKHKGQSYYFIESTWSAFQFLDDRTFLVGSEESVFQRLDRPAPRSATHLTGALREARERHHIVAGFKADILALAMMPFREERKTFDSIGGEPAPRKEPEKEVVSARTVTMASLLKASGLTLTFDFDKELCGQARLDFPSDEQAAAGVKAVRALIAAARDSLGVSRTSLEDLLRDGWRDPYDFGRRPQQPQGAKPLTNDLRQATGDLATLAILGIYRSCDEYLQAIAVEQQSKSVAVRGHLPLNMQNAFLGISVISALGTNANKTFTSVSATIGSSNSGEARDDLKPLAKALDDYHKKHGRFAAHARYNAQGEPLLSWRVELLPFLGEEPLYKQFKLDEPWDSNHNKRLLKKMPKALQVWGDAWTTPYQAFVGKGAAFEGKEGLKRSDFTDGADQTILVVKAEEPRVPWTKPADLDYDPDEPLPRFRYRDENGFTAIFADGAVRLIKENTDAKAVRALITRNGGEALKEVPPGSGRVELDAAAMDERGHRAVNLRVKTDGFTETTWPTPSSRVDLMVTRKNETTKTVLLENVLVVTGQLDRKDFKTGDGIVTLALTPENALKVALAREVGSIHMVRRQFWQSEVKHKAIAQEGFELKKGMRAVAVRVETATIAGGWFALPRSARRCDPLHEGDERSTW